MLLLLFVSICLFSPCLAGPSEELITSLPNLVEPMRSKQYSGYLNISSTKSLHYWYIESENNPSTDPVVLWLNGGPGCSSLEGLFVEMGPFRANNNGKSVSRNMWTWNRYASIIYLDAPAGVGFSMRTDNQSLWKYTDQEVANDNHLAINKWFQKFPERKNNSLFVAGESYGGTYVPMLGVRLLNDTKYDKTFQGVLIGNGCVDDKLNYNTNVDFNYYHGVVDETYFRNAVNKCCPNATYFGGCDWYKYSLVQNGTCYTESTTLNLAAIYAEIDPYFLYYSCYLIPADKPGYGQPTTYQSTVAQRHMINTSNKNVVVACSQYNDSTTYLQMDSVRKALHIPDIVPKYTSCSDAVAGQYDLANKVTSQTDNVKTLVSAGKRVTLFNGDTDSICNGIHNQQFVKNLGLKLKKSISPWNDIHQSPASIGELTQYQGLDYLTIRGAGHFAASSNEKPKEAMQMFVNFIHGQDYSTPVSEDKPYITSPASVATIFTTVLLVFKHLIV